MFQVLLFLTKSQLSKLFLGAIELTKIKTIGRRISKIAITKNGISKISFLLKNSPLKIFELKIFFSIISFRIFFH
ncbi:Uncharacterised protein [Mycoplasmopsis synoviae]|uniref:Uncharacterized protein n=1 Tax=Mycoplasmopsis synoviae TaxID=2109 RepID=A0A3B0PBK0_MYCSY|nr:Uncharacterised protein [Mycoplasmopsis synoviae]